MQKREPIEKESMRLTRGCELQVTKVYGGRGEVDVLFSIVNEILFF